MTDEHATHIQLFQGDCLAILPGIKDSSVDLIVTSPPYADTRVSRAALARKSTTGSDATLPIPTMSAPRDRM